MSAELRTERRKPSGEVRSTRLLDAADLLCFVGLLNLLVILSSIVGLIVFGTAPALAAAAACSRARLHHDGRSVTRRFVAEWRRHFARANLLFLPALAALALLVVNAISLADTATTMSVTSGVAAGLVLVILLIAVAMDSHYELRKRDVLMLASRFVISSPGAALLVAAALTVVAAVTALLPGLFPVVSIGCALHVVTALCLSFFATNEELIASH